MSVRVPQFKNLQAFEAAGRLGSFKAAAAELNLTPSAISHRITALEASLEETLFEPRGRGTALTATGQTYLASIQRVLDQLSTATDQIKHKGVSGPLTIRLYATFSRGWLIPRLQRFVRQYDKIELNLVTTQTPLDPSSGDTDIVIEYLESPLPDHQCDLLCADRVFAVCSPQYEKLNGPFRTVADLMDAALIHNSHRPDEWSWWLGGQRILNQHRGGRLRVATRNTAIDAAEAGLGFALAHWPMAEAALRQRSLVSPFGSPLETGFCFYMVTTRERAALPRVAAFRDWILGEFAREPFGAARLGIGSPGA